MKLPTIRFASRAEAVRDLRARLESGSWPRLQMMLLVMLTGASGFIASVVMLAVGMQRMGLRYLLACCVAYACFLGLLWIWIHWRKGDHVDLPHLPDLPGDGAGWRGGGGSSGGGGASASFDAPNVPTPFSSPASSSSKSGFDLPDVDADAVPVLLLLMVAALLLSSLFVVWTAPVLFAELLLDGVLATGLYRRLRHIETRHWLQTALRKTAWPFVLTTAVLAACGYGLQVAIPGADSIGDALRLVL